VPPAGSDAANSSATKLTIAGIICYKLERAAEMKAIFIDRDGTINVEKGHVHRIEDWEFIPGAIEALRLLSDHGIRIYIITNQSGIARGLYTEAQFHELTRYVAEDLEAKGVRIEKVLYCPHHPEGKVPEYSFECGCRKPNTLLIEEVLANERLAKSDVALIGDKNTDIEAGTRLGLITYLVLTGYGRTEAATTKATHVVPDLLHAVRHLLTIS
jgi:D-glycero-D-manno-heptose 1,7-bisphosphate phosphatase